MPRRREQEDIAAGCWPGEGRAVCSSVRGARRQEERRRLARVFELLSLEKHAGTVAGEARTRSTKHNDVSTHHQRSKRSSSGQRRAQEARAQMRADLLDRVALHDLLHLTVVLCTGAGASWCSWTHPACRARCAGYCTCGRGVAAEESRLRMEPQAQSKQQDMIGCALRRRI